VRSKVTRVLRITAVLAVFGSSGALAATAWNESVQGDLSNDRLNPTAVTFTSGSNQMVGAAENAGSGVDRDYFEITVAPGQELSSITPLVGTTVSGLYNTDSPAIIWPALPTGLETLCWHWFLQADHRLSVTETPSRTV